MELVITVRIVSLMKCRVRSTICPVRRRCLGNTSGKRHCGKRVDMTFAVRLHTRSSETVIGVHDIAIGIQAVLRYVRGTVVGTSVNGRVVFERG